MKVQASFLFASVAMAWVFGCAKSPAEGLNNDMGIPLWSDNYLWDDDIQQTAKRLKLEARGVGLAATYMSQLPEDTKILGVRAFTLHLYPDATGKVRQVVVGFVNRADLEREAHIGENESVATAQAQMEAEKKFIKMMATDPAIIVKNITRNAGRPKEEGTKKTWDWSQHVMILNQNSDSLVLNIQQASKGGAGPGAPVNPVRAAAQARFKVERRSNGDVVIEGIPMLSQGSRGYCVPATWEKYLRFLGLGIDVYQLVEQGGTQTSGSQWLPFAARVGARLEPQGFQVKFVEGKATSLNVLKEHIDRGMPLMWAMDAKDLPLWVTRTSQRSGRLEKFDRPKKKAPVGPPAAPHALMIIGYNSGFREICLSDSTDLGSNLQEIWITQEDAKEVDSPNPLIVIVPKTGASQGSQPDGYTPPTSTGKKWY
jgi:hypothetical protein